MAEVKYAAEYHKMTQAEKDVYDKINLAQMKVDKENKKALAEKINKDGMTKEAWDKLTPEEQAAAKDKMKDMREMAEGKMEEMQKKMMEMKMKAGYANMTDA